MREYFELVKPACDFAGVVHEDATISVLNGRMEAQNGSLQVSQPVVGIEDFAAPAADIDYNLRKVGECTVSVGEQFVIMKSKLGTTRTKRVTNRLANFTKPDIETHPIDDLDDLMGAIDDVFPFTVGDPSKPWSQGARFDGKMITATNSIMLCRAELAQSCGFQGVTLSRAALSYMRLRRDALTRWGFGDRGLLLEFKDGAWALSPRLNVEMPDQAVKLIDQAIPKDAWGLLADLDPAYRTALLSAVDHTESILMVFPDHVFGTRLSSDHRCNIETKLGAGVEKALFTAKDLTTVVSVANQIGFDHYPRPVPFTTERGSKGLLAGRSA
ncbi:DNA polymerase III subunit beta [Pseudanabaena phage Pan1]|nr:DNA polymerase III subunit beta [Pseudanabaena phage Pan1]